MDPDVFELVYEGFWDLYTLKPRVKDVSAKKLQQEWIKKINLKASERTEADEPAAEAKEEKADEDGEEKPEADGEEADEEKKEPEYAEDVIEAPNAIVRVKIPKVKPDPQQDEEGNDIVIEYTEAQLDELDDVPFEDKVLSFETQKDDSKIWVINHLASKTMLKDLGNEFR